MFFKVRGSSVHSMQHEVARFLGESSVGRALNCMEREVAGSISGAELDGATKQIAQRTGQNFHCLLRNG